MDWFRLGCALFLVTSSIAGQPKDLEYLERKLRTAEGTERIETLLDLIEIQKQQRNPKGVLRFAEQASQLIDQKKLTEFEVDILIHRSWANGALGKFDQAKEDCTQGRAFAEKIGYRKGIGNALNTFGSIFQREGSYDKALAYFLEALSLREELNDRIGIAECFDNIGITYSYQSDYDQSLEYFHRSLKIKQDLDDKAGIAFSFNNLGEIHRRKGDYDIALGFYLKSVELKEEVDDKAGLALSLNNIGIVYKRKGLIDKALEYYLKALKIREELGNKAGIASTLNNIGLIYRSKGIYDQALEFFLKSLKIKEELGKKASIASTLNNIGLLYSDNRSYDKALEFHLKSLKIKEELGNKAGISSSLNNLGLIYEAKGSFKKALELYLQVLEIREEVGDKDGISWTLHSIGSVQTQLGQFSQAHNSLSKSLSFSQTINNRPLASYTLLTFAELFRKTNHYTKALAHVDEALILAQEMEKKDLIRDCFLEQSNILSARGNHKEALSAFKKYKATYDELHTIESNNKIANLQGVYDLEKREKEIAILKRESEIKSLENSRTLLLKDKAIQRLKVKRQQAILLLVGLAFFGLVGFFLQYWRTNKKQLAQERIVIDRLKQMDQLKDAFLANTSHELRTPLNGIIGIAESLLDGSSGPVSPETGKNLSMIIGSGRRLAGLVSDILDFSKLREDSLNLSLQPISLHSSVDIVLTLSKPLIKSKSLKLVNDIPEDFSAVYADENRIQQILFNLVGNAIKFSDQGVIRIHASVEEAFVQIEVSDTGMGIPKEKYEQIFDSFQQLDGSTNRVHGGTGLGLAITRQLVELHGGRIWVQSEVGKGTTFFFTLQRSQEKPLAVSELKTIHELVYDDDETELINPSTPSSEFKILIADDDPINRQVLRNHLALHGYHILEAENGYLALELIDREDPDLVLLDIMMPRISGYEVCKKIRRLKPLYQLPVIYLSAKNQVQDLVQGFETGGNDYLSKPISKNELLARVRTHLNLLKIHASTSRFFPNEFLRALGKESVVDVKVGDNIYDHMVVFFSDIRGYSQLAENMSPNDTFHFLNGYLQRVAPIFRSFGGFVNQFYGDGIMAIFPKKKSEAVLAAIAIQEKVYEYNETRKAKGRLPIKIGIGLHHGPLMMGIIGDGERTDTGVVADTVNTSARIEGLTKLYGCSILISDDMKISMEKGDGITLRLLDKVRVKGRQTPLTIYDVVDGEPASVQKLKLETLSDFKQGVDAYFNQEFLTAQSCFERVTAVHPNDKAAILLKERSEMLNREGAPHDWDGCYNWTLK